MDKRAEVAELLFGGGADELVMKFSEGNKDRKKRAITAGLSAVGGAAGALGLAVGGRAVGKEVRAVHRAAPELGKLKALKAGWKNTDKWNRVLAPAEVAGLGGEVMSTKILSGDVKKPKSNVAKADPGNSDVHISGVPSVGKLKRVAATKAYEKGKPMAVEAGGKLYSKTKGAVCKSVSWEGEISKIDEDKRQVFGWASIVEVDGKPVVDLQGDYIDIDEVEKSAYEYVIKSRKGGDMHRRNDDGTVVHSSDMIESFIVTPEKKASMGLPDDTPTGWWVGFLVNDDETWRQVKSGERTAFSLHGRGVRTPMEV